MADEQKSFGERSSAELSDLTNLSPEERLAKSNEVCERALREALKHPGNIECAVIIMRVKQGDDEGVALSSSGNAFTISSMMSEALPVLAENLRKNDPEYAGYQDKLNGLKDVLEEVLTAARRGGKQDNELSEFLARTAKKKDDKLDIN
jgi:hypothetical protein